MIWDFSGVMVVMVGASGLIWATDSLVFAPKRRKRLASQGAATEELEAAAERKPILVDYARSFFPIFLIVLLLRSFLVEPFRIPSGSMMPTLLVGDFILVNKYDYGIRLPLFDTKVINIGEPKRGDVVVFRYPKDPSIPFIKRIIGVPGDHIVYHDKTLFINGKRVSDQTEGRYIGTGSGEMMTGSLEYKEDLPGHPHDILIIPGRPSVDVDLRVPAGEYFVLGDNRDNSKDSRYWGFVPDANLIGRAFMIWMNWDSKNGGVDWKRIGDRIN